MDNTSSHLAPKVLTVAKVLSLALQIPNYQGLNERVKGYTYADKQARECTIKL